MYLVKIIYFLTFFFNIDNFSVYNFTFILVLKLGTGKNKMFLLATNNNSFVIFKENVLLHLYVHFEK